MKFDVVITNAYIVDGSGEAPYTGCIGILDGVIAHIGTEDLPADATAERSIDAAGRVVAPGWVDVHSHFDAQAIWDPWLTPSCAAGVTTLVAGNCGVGFAPCRPHQRDYLVQLMEGVEDIPADALKAGLGTQPDGGWEWETFPEYLDSLGSRQFAGDLAVMVSHGAVRTYVLDEERNRAADRPGGCFAVSITDEEISQMAEIVREAIEAGAIGFSCNRFANHRDGAGGLVPGTLSLPEEAVALSRAVAEGGGGLIEVVSDFTVYDDIPFNQMDPEIRQVKQHTEWAWMEHVMKEYKLPFSIGSGWGNDLADPDPTKHVGHFQRYDDHVAQGMTLKGQVMVRPQGFLQCFESKLNHFNGSSTYQELKRTLSSEAFRDKLLEKETRSQILAECKEIYDPAPGETRGRADWYQYDNSRWYDWQAGYEPAEEDSIRSIAQQDGRHVLDIAYDILSQDRGRGVMWRPHQNYGTGNLDQTFNALMHDGCIPGTSDAGAHNAIMQDSTASTHMLTHFVRDRTRGKKMPIEFAVRRQTKDTARLFGLNDRGTLETGMRADLNVIDMEKLQIFKPSFESDLPTGAQRWMQSVTGYDITMVNGVITYEDGASTGALPGRLVRNPRTWENTPNRNLDAAFVDPLKELITARRLELGEELSGGSLEEAMKAQDNVGLTSISRQARQQAQKEAQKSKL